MRCVFQHKNNVRSSLQEKCPLSKVHCSNLMFKDLKRQLMRSICTGDRHYIEHHAFNILANSPQTCSLISAWHRTHPTDYWQKSRFWTLTCAKPLSLIHINCSSFLCNNNDISEGHHWLQLWGRMRVHKGTTSGLWQSYLHITPEVEYWFSAKEHHSQERCATLVKEPCTPRGMMGEHKAGKKAITGILWGKEGGQSMAELKES